MLTHNLDFSSLHALVNTLVGLILITLLGVGIRLLLMQTLQQRRERENRQINERLRALIATYRTLGGSFTGNLAVDPTHLRDLRSASMAVGAVPSADDTTSAGAASLPTVEASADVAAQADAGRSDRARRIRDAVESALADIILLGTEEQVRLAAQAATEMTQNNLIHTSELVASLRDFIRNVLDLGPVPSSVLIPLQGPARPRGAGSKSAGKDDGSRKGEGTGGGKGMGGGDGGEGGGEGLESGARHQEQDAHGHE